MKAKKVIVTCGICLVMLALLSGCFGTCIEVIQISISGISQCAYIAKNGQFPEEEFETKIIYSDDEKFVFNFGDIGFNSYVYVNGEKRNLEVLPVPSNLSNRFMHFFGNVYNDPTKLSSILSVERWEKEDGIVLRIVYALHYFDTEYGYKEGDKISFNVMEYEDWIKLHPEDTIPEQTDNEQTEQ